MLKSLGSSVIALLLLVAPSNGQALFREHLGSYGLGYFGYAAGHLSDLDGDGVADYALADADPVEGVDVFSGKLGVQLFRIDGDPTALYGFGFGIEDAGDLDGDGTHDLLIGEPHYGDSGGLWGYGAVFAYSGADGHFLQAVYGSASRDQLKGGVALDDVDADGTLDFLAGASQDHGNGYVRCYSGRTGAILYEIDGANAGDGLSRPLPLSDRDGDGIRDFAARTLTYTSIYSGASAALLTSIPAEAGTWNTGLAEIADIDGDGFPELTMGEVEFPTLAYRVRVMSIPTQTQLRLHLGDVANDAFGSVQSSITDADGDGITDYLLGSPQLGLGLDSASIYSGRTGERLYRFVDRTSVLMGAPLADVGDLDGDGFSEMLVGSPDLPPYGAIYLFSGNDLWLNAEPKFPIAGASESLIMHGAPAGNPIALFLTDVNGAPMMQLLAFGFADSVESFTLSGTVPAGLAGTTMTFHAFALDASSHIISSADEVIAFQ